MLAVLVADNARCNRDGLAFVQGSLSLCGWPSEVFESRG